MHRLPTIHYKFPHRRPGTFGGSLPGDFAEWVTTTWLRFGIFVLWLIVAVVVLLTPSAIEGAPKILLLLISPLFAAFLFLALKLSRAIFYFLPVAGPIVGIAHLFYIRCFSHLIIEEAASVEFPLWYQRN